MQSKKFQLEERENICDCNVFTYFKRILENFHKLKFKCPKYSKEFSKQTWFSDPHVQIEKDIYSVFKKSV